MAIKVRRGNFVDFDPNKLVEGELSVILDKGELFFCFSPGNTKKLTTAEDVQAILNSSPEAYSALQQVLVDLESNPSELTNILNNILALQNGKLDKTGDSKYNTTSFIEVTTRENIASGESHETFFSKIKKFFTDIKALAFKDKIASTDLETTLKAYIDAKFDSVNIIQTTVVNDTTKVPSSAVSYSLQQAITSNTNSITTLNNNLVRQDITALLVNGYVNTSSIIASRSGSIVSISLYLVLIGTVTNGTVIMTLPAPFRPSVLRYCELHTTNGSSSDEILYHVRLSIDVDGAVKLTHEYTHKTTHAYLMGTLMFSI